MQDTDFEKAGELAREKDAAQAANTFAQLDAIVPKSDEFVIYDLEKEAHLFKKQTFPTFKTAEVLKMLAGVKDDIDLVELVTEVQQLVRPTTQGEDANLQAGMKLNAALNAIPKLIEVAPDVLLDFAALAIITNKELREAADKGELRELRSQNRRWIEFECSVNAPIEIFAAYLPYLGVDFLVKALSSLNLSITKTFDQLSQV